MESRLLSLQRQIDRVIAYLSPLLPLANCHTVEFLSEQLWGRLVPSALRAELDALPLPEALERFWAAAAADLDTDDAYCTELDRFVRAARHRHLRADGRTCLTEEQAARRVGRGDHRIRLDEFVTPKKGYEVHALWPLATALGGSHCVELGGGRGYVGEALARCAGRRALTVDCDAAALAGGRARADRMQRMYSKRFQDGAAPAEAGAGGGGRHRYARALISEKTDLHSLLRESFPEDFEPGADDISILITGLHTCGDLGADSLRIFAGERSARALCNVPCCYHLLREGAGFPASRHLARPGFRLGRNARMLASQSLERAVATRTPPSLGLHYRAVLQALLKEHHPEREIAEGRLKGVAAKCQNFEQYYKMAAGRLHLDASISDDALAAAEAKYERHHKSLVMFYLLRLCLAQAVECVILLDRLLYLVEMGFDDAFIVKLFDATKSPRCHAIVAVR